MPKRKDETEESEEFDDDDSEENQKIQIRKPKVQRIDKFKNLKKIVINVSMTQYPVVAEVADELNWKLQTSNDAGDWDIYWTDFTIDPDVLIRMHLFQKINHYPGIHVIARKNLLGINLTNMKKYYPDQYNFFPLTWMLPQQYAEFREYYESKPKGKARTYIVKPQADCQGRGIFLTRKLEDLENGKHYVVQRYIARPLLLDGLKFDFRIYLLLCGTNPLRLYMYKEGLARLATQLYHQPAYANLDKLCMHLTNYAINKHNPKFIFNSNSANMGIGHKRSLTCVWNQLAKKGLDVQELKKKIKDMLIKTIITGLPLMRHQYKCSQPEDYSGNMCFHILGMDVMLNNKGEPFVLQVNHTPSFTTDTPLDHKIKFNLIKDTLVLMNINTKTKNQLYNRCKQYNTERLLTGKRHIYEGPDRDQKIMEAQMIRDKYQQKHLGGYEKIFPLDDPEENKKYEEMIEKSIEVYYKETNSIRNRNEEKQMKKLFKNDLKNRKVAEKIQQTPKEMPKEIPKEILKEMPKEGMKQQQSQHATRSQIQRRKTKQQTLQSKNNSAIVESVVRSPNSQPFKTPISNLHNKKQINHQKTSYGSKINQILEKKEEMNEAHMAKFKRKRQNSQAFNKKQKSEEGKMTEVKLRTKIITPGSEMRMSEKNNLPNIIDNNITVSQIFHRSQYQNMKRQERTNNIKVQSEPKNSKIEFSEKDIKLINEKKLLCGGNGGYVMPKIFCMNIEKQQDELNFITTGKKIHNIFYDEE